MDGASDLSVRESKNVTVKNERQCGGVLRACPSIVASRESSRSAVAWTSTNRLDGVVCRTCGAVPPPRPR